MIIRKAHCLFEQSGTFKNAFISNGIPAEDYDICNDFGKTDHVVDLFFEINKAYEGGGSIFDEITNEDIIFAFFPCTRFEGQISLWFKGVAKQQKTWSEEEKLIKSMKLQKELTQFYLLVSKLCIVCIRNNLRLIIENPNSNPHYLTNYFPIKASVIDKDRSLNGDEQKKPTQYWFINCKPENNIMVDLQTERKSLYSHNKGGTKEGSEGMSKTVVRSMINPKYANWFIRTYLMTL